MIDRWQGERHYVNRLGWLRAAVLGANDGILTVASMLVGVVATHVAPAQITLIGVASLVAGSMSMGAGEYVSVSSQADSERADLDRERHELQTNEAYELQELAGLYVQRGLQPALAHQVATQLMAHDALGAHAREELGLVDGEGAQPLRAALASAASFASGGLVPLLLALLAPGSRQLVCIAGGSLLCLAALGALAAKVGGAPKLVGAARVAFWGALAMALTAAAGHFFGAVA